VADVSFNPPCILLVEDDAISRYATGRILEAQGWRVVYAGSAEEALRRLEDRTSGIDVLLTDIRLSGRDGIDLVSTACGDDPSLKAVLVTGYSDLALPWPTLTKPFTDTHLLRVLHSVLGVKAGAHSPAEL
jgi:two-component system, cell cycle sensor histidine kinase and response regulator CckA